MSAFSGVRATLQLRPTYGRAPRMPTKQQRSVDALFLCICAAMPIVLLPIGCSDDGDTQKTQSAAEQASAGSASTAKPAELRAKKSYSTADLPALLPDIPDDENGAIIIEKLADKLEKLTGDPAAVAGVPQFDPDANIKDLFDGIPRRKLQAAASFLAEHRDLVDELSVLKDYRTGRVTTIDWNVPVNEEPSLLLLPDFSAWRNAGRLQYLVALKHLAKRDMDAAYETVLGQLAIASTLEHEPTLITGLIRTANLWMSIQTIEALLRVGELTEEQLQNLSMVLADISDAPGPERQLKGERAMVCQTLDSVAKGKLSPERLVYAGMIAGKRVSKSDCQAMYDDAADLFSNLIDRADDFVELIRAANEYDEDVEAGMDELIKTMVPSMTSCFELLAKINGHLRATQVMIACERYRLQHGDWPESQESLVPGFLDQLPLDPFTNKPLRMIRKPNGYIIYSLGTNMEDDGGKLWREGRGRPRQPDVGVRLVDPAKRGSITRN